MDWLDDEELIELTRRRQAAAQRRVLESWGVLYRVRPDGTPLVLRSVLERALGAPARVNPAAPNGLRWSKAA